MPSIPVGEVLSEDGPLLPKRVGDRPPNPLMFFCPVDTHGRLRWYHTEAGILFCPKCKLFYSAKDAQEG